MKILGISAYYHDSAAALLIDGRIVAAAQEERFSRIKHDASFPAQAIAYCLDYAGLTVDELDSVVFYDKPFLKFERLLHTFYQVAPRGLSFFIRSMPIWIKEKLFLKARLRRALRPFNEDRPVSTKLLFPSHHLSHAASTFYTSPFDSAAILTVDGVGEWATASICHGQGRHIKLLRELHFPHSLGLLYSAFTYFLGFRVNSGEYKLMGLAPYGDPTSEKVARFRQLIETHLIDLREDGSLHLHQEYFRYTTGDRMIDIERWENLFGFPLRTPEEPFEDDHVQLALAIQQVTENCVLRLAAEAAKLTGERRLCLAGGVALNCVANGKVLRSGLFDDLHIQPAAGDAGGAIGAALAAHYLSFEQDRPAVTADLMQGAYLGPEFSHLDIERSLRKHRAAAQRFTDLEELTATVAKLLADGKVIGWFQGRMEFGPRALGNRSILGDARRPELQRTLNLKIKNRESFRPFAPAVLAEDADQYFELEAPSPYMLLVAPVRADRRLPLPDHYHFLPLREKLAIQRSDIPAVTHVDFSARIQTVTEQRNPRFYQLLQAFKRLTGYSLLVNTSFNVRDEPIVCTPEDAYRCFQSTEMDYLVLGDYVVSK